MAPVKIFGTANQPILSLADWERFGGPQKSFQWQDGRSAKECAKAWLRTGGPALPSELAALFSTHPLTSQLVIDRAYPEVETRLDRFQGNGRFHDLVLEGVSEEREVVVSIEAKADESFGDLVRKARTNALARKPTTKVPARMDLLRDALFGSGVVIDDLRYQLLYAVAGTLIEARQRGADLAVFVVHEFAFKGHVTAAKLARNAADLDRMLKALGLSSPLAAGTLTQVPSPPGGTFVPAGIDLLVGKVRVP